MWLPLDWELHNIKSMDSFSTKLSLKQNTCEALVSLDSYFFQVVEAWCWRYYSKPCSLFGLIKTYHYILVAFFSLVWNVHICALTYWSTQHMLKKKKSQSLWKMKFADGYFVWVQNKGPSCTNTFYDLTTGNDQIISILAINFVLWKPFGIISAPFFFDSVTCKKCRSNTADVLQRSRRNRGKQLNCPAL